MLTIITLDLREKLQLHGSVMTVVPCIIKLYEENFNQSLPSTPCKGHSGVHLNRWLHFCYMFHQIIYELTANTSSKLTGEPRSLKEKRTNNDNLTRCSGPNNDNLTRCSGFARSSGRAALCRSPGYRLSRDAFWLRRVNTNRKCGRDQRPYQLLTKKSFCRLQSILIVRQLRLLRALQRLCGHWTLTTGCWTRVPLSQHQLRHPVRKMLNHCTKDIKVPYAYWNMASSWWNASIVWKLLSY